VAAPGGNGVPSARTVLEVADGLRWTDPGLGASLAEHALRLAGDDAAVRMAAERSVIRSLAEVDRFDEVVSRATPLLDDAQMRGDREDLAGLLVDLAGAAIGFDDHAVAERLVEPVSSARDLSPRTVALAGLVRAQLAAATGDVAGADRAAQEAGEGLSATPEPEAGLVRRDLARARAAARRRGGDAGSALPILADAVSADPGVDADGGRRSLLASADQVDLLLDLGRRDDALERGRAALPNGPAEPLAVCSAARIRLALAERVHLVSGAHAEAEALARSAAAELEAAGHDAAAARAWEVVASAAESGGALGNALTAVRHGHELDSRARDRRDPALRVLTMIAAAGLELPAAPAPPIEQAAFPAASSASPQQAPADPPDSSALSDVESLLADARASFTGGVDGTTSLPRRRGHRREDGDQADADRSEPGAESVPEALARLLGGGAEPSPEPGSAWADARPPDGTGDALGGTSYGGPGGLPGNEDAGLPSSSGLTPLGSGRRSRHSAERPDDLLADPLVTRGADDDSPPRFDTLPDAPGRGLDADGPVQESSAPAWLVDPEVAWNGLGDVRPDQRTPGDVAEDRFAPVEAERPGPPGSPSSAVMAHPGSDQRGERARALGIDPADPLGTGFSWGALADEGTPSRATSGAIPGERDERPRDVGPDPRDLLAPRPGGQDSSRRDAGRGTEDRLGADAGGGADDHRGADDRRGAGDRGNDRGGADDRCGSDVGRGPDGLRGREPAAGDGPGRGHLAARGPEPTRESNGLLGGDSVRAQEPGRGDEPLRRPESLRGSEGVRGDVAGGVPGPGAEPPSSSRGPGGRAVPAGFDPEDLEDELPLTLAGLLAEYHLPDVPAPPYRERARPADVDVPSARRHISGSMPVPAADQRFAPRPGDAPDRPAPAPTNGATHGPARRGENGARLADLLAEAMDAFRHTGSSDAPRPPGDAGRPPGDGARGPGDAARGPGVGSRRG
jgi:hypothetical protein